MTKVAIQPQVHTILEKLRNFVAIITMVLISLVCCLYISKHFNKSHKFDVEGNDTASQIIEVSQNQNHTTERIPDLETTGGNLLFRNTSQYLSFVF